MDGRTEDRGLDGQPENIIGPPFGRTYKKECSLAQEDDIKRHHPWTHVDNDITFTYTNTFQS